MVIYKVTNKINGKLYIGQTIGDPNRRWQAHCKKSGCRALSSAIQLYGKEAFIFSVVGAYSTVDELNDAEEYFIDFYNCLAPNGYNLQTGGNNHLVSAESRLRSSQSHKGKHHAGTFKPGRVEPEEIKARRIAKMLGKKHPLAVKQKMSESHKKVVHTAEWNRAVAKSLLGKKHSEVSKRKMSEARKNKTWYVDKETGKRIVLNKRAA